MNRAINKIDRIKVEGMLQAEKKCRKLNMGKVPYFPQLAIQINRVVLVRALKQKVMVAKVKHATIKRLVKKADVELEVINELKGKEEIRLRLQKELIKYWEMKAQAWISRKNS